ncbi:hypothetical protein [Xenophilus sp.]
MAAQPSAAQLSEIQALFGYDRVFAAFFDRMAAGIAGNLLDAALEGLPPSAHAFREEIVTPAERARLEGCVRHEASAGFAPAIDDLMREQFESGENVEAWKAFAQTSAGATVMQFVREGLRTPAGAHQHMRSAIARSAGALTSEQKAEVAQFLRSPAGRVIGKDVPSPSFDTDAVAQRVFDACVMDPEAARRIEELNRRRP